MNFVSGMNVVTEVVHLVSSSTVRVPFLESLEAPILQCRFKYVKPKVATLVKFHPDFHYFHPDFHQFLSVVQGDQYGSVLHF